MFTRTVIRNLFLVCLAGLMLVLGACTTKEPSAAPVPTTVPSAPATAPVAAAPGGTTQPGGSSLEGQWEGTIYVATQKIGMVIRFRGDGSGLKGLMDITAQGAKDIPLSKISSNGPKVHFEAFSGQRLATYDGDMAADGSLSGNFSQAGYKGTFTLTRVARAAAQAPTAEVPYKQEEVTVKNGDVSLAGTLTLPPAGGPFPAVILITGSGAQNRDEDLFGFQPFRLIADDFTRNGIAVLRMDDRGIGGSTGDMTNATTEDFAGDVTAAVSFLKARSDVNPKQIGLLGHSEGGIIAPMVANRTSDVAFIILYAGPGLSGAKVIEQQVADILRSKGTSQADIDTAVAEQTKIMNMVLTDQGWDALEASMRTQAQAQIAAMPADQRAALGDEKSAVDEAVQGQLAALKSPWYKFFLGYDPAPALAKVKVPVLAVFGGKDVQVAAGPNEQAVKAALGQGGNTRVTTKIYPEANHLFQPAKTGSPDEYAQLNTLVPGLLDDLVQWIQTTIKH